MQCVCCGKPPPTSKVLYVCWLCAGDPAGGFIDTLSFNENTGLYQGSQTRGTSDGTTISLQRLCGSQWLPSTAITVPITGPSNNPPFTNAQDTCCSCGIALISVSTSPPRTCGLGCELGIFGSPYNQLPNDWDVQIGASLTNLGWNSCPAMADTYTVSGGLCSWNFSHGIGIIMPGKSCGIESPCNSFLGVPYPPCPENPDINCCNADGHGGCDPGCYQSCFPDLPNYFPEGGTGCGSCGITILLSFIAGTCGGHFILDIIFGCSGSLGDNTSGKQDCRGRGSYASDFFPVISPVPSSFTVHGGGSAGPACNGSLPGSITITAA